MLCLTYEGTKQVGVSESLGLSSPQPSPQLEPRLWSTSPWMTPKHAGPPRELWLERIGIDGADAPLRHAESHTVSSRQALVNQMPRVGCFMVLSRHS